MKRPLLHHQRCIEVVRRRKAGLLLRGATFAHRRRLREAGAWYDVIANAWLLPNHELARELGAVIMDDEYWLKPEPKKAAQ